MYKESNTRHTRQAFFVVKNYKHKLLMGLVSSLGKGDKIFRNHKSHGMNLTLACVVTSAFANSRGPRHSHRPYRPRRFQRWRSVPISERGNI
jgi:hypothetical protein